MKLNGLDVEVITVVTTVGQLARFRDAGRFETLCQQCPNYGRRWGCPPLLPEDYAAFVDNPEQAVTVVAAKVRPPESHMPLASADDILRVVREWLEPELLRFESRTGGAAALFTGRCMRCAGACARESGKPCRHPALTRPSLEAMGFDLTAIARELAGIEILWGIDGQLPDYLTLVAAVTGVLPDEFGCA